MNDRHPHPSAPAAYLRQHWPEYLMEAAELGAFMFLLCIVVVAVQHPDSPIHQAIPDPLLRRALCGAMMGSVAVALVYSPWGRRSGAHMNPVFTLTFWRLGKIATWDAIFYALAQCVGGLAGVLLAKLILSAALAHPSINYVVTIPGPRGVAIAWLAEMLISLALMLMVLIVSNHARLARWTGLFAGPLIAVFVTFEAPLSGMSMNPARSFDSAIFSGQWTAFWVYLSAPTVGMLAAAWLYVRARGLCNVRCAKMCHYSHHRCIFCEHQHRHETELDTLNLSACADPASLVESSPDGR